MSEDALPGTTRAKTHSDEFRSTMDQIRTRTNTTAKGLAAVGTAAIGGLGYAKLADVYPYHGPTGAKLALVLGVVVMLGSVLFLVRNFFKASQTIMTKPDIAETIAANGITKRREKALIRQAYGEAAEASGVADLSELESRGRELEKKAAKAEEAGDAPKAARRHREAERDFAEVQAAQDRATTFILRRRATSALFGALPLVLIALFVAGWYCTALAADAMQSERSDEIEVVKKCGEARKAIGEVKATTPNACEDWGLGPWKKKPAKPERQTAGNIAADTVAELAAGRARCVHAAEANGKKPADACAALTRALRNSTPRNRR